MGNTTLPTPVLLAAAAFCLLAGYLVGAVAGPDTPELTTATVASYDADRNRLCLRGESAAAHPAADPVTGRLCGVWRHPAGADTPEEGDRFRFVATRSQEAPEGVASEQAARVLIYGTVVD